MPLKTALTSTGVVLETRDLCKYYNVQRPFSRERYTVKAVDYVNLQVRKGEVFGLVGESGCGKSTIGRLILRLIEATHGTILFNQQDILTLKKEALFEMRRQMQIVFQDPYSSLNPSFSVKNILLEGLSKRPGWDSHETGDHLSELIERVGLSREYLSMFPHQLSGGQRQRVGVARALSVDPQFLVADEPTSALDVSIQAQILDLFIDLQQRLGLAILFISHDFSVIRYLCERVAVMYLGQIVEEGATRAVLDHPQHPYTAGLLSSIPRIEQRGIRERRLLPGELPSPTSLPQGCRFHPRCAFAQDRCRKEAPLLSETGQGRKAACFFPLV